MNLQKAVNLYIDVQTWQILEIHNSHSSAYTLSSSWEEVVTLHFSNVQVIWSLVTVSLLCIQEGKKKDRVWLSLLICLLSCGKRLQSQEPWRSTHRNGWVQEMVHFSETSPGKMMKSYTQNRTHRKKHISFNKSKWINK